KPIYAYYLGDFDPSGFDLERDLREKLARYSGGSFNWYRLAIQKTDFADHDLIALPVKESDRRSRGFVQKYGERCAEVDALPPTELRQRVEDAIQAHIDRRRWARLRQVEEAEKATLIDFCANLRA